MVEEAQFTGGQLLQTESGGEVLAKAWAPFVQNRVFETVTFFNAIAITGGNLAEIQLHVWMGIDVEAQRITEGSAVSPLLVAAYSNKKETVVYFIELGYDKEVEYILGGTGMTILMYVCTQGYEELAEYLLDQGCDTDHANIKGWTALHFAAGHGHLNVSQLLFRYGAQLDARNSNGETPIDFATRRGHHHITDAIRAEIQWSKRRMAVFVAFKAVCAEGAEQPLLARLRLDCPDIMRHVISFL
jgi:hypothetical protein